MPHTLKAYYYTDPATAVTVDFYGAVSDNDGIAVDAYEMGVPGVDQARNNSLYSDSPRPVYSKHSTITDVLTVTVRGSTNTNLYTNLHLLAKLGEYARKAMQAPTDSPFAYLEMKPGGSSAGEVLYATIYDCRVSMPSDWANVQDATLTVDNVTVTIERGIWYGGASVPVSVVDQLSASGTAGTAIGGDTHPAIGFVRVYSVSAPPPVAIDRVIIGVRSKLLGGDQYNAAGKFESESATNGTDTSDAADATASGGNKITCTFATPTNALRSSGVSVPRGVHRMFARMKITSTAVASVYLSYSDETIANGGSPIANTAVSVTSTAWHVFDMGIVRAFMTEDGTATSQLGTYFIYASLTSGAGNLDIDWVFCMPTESYFTASGGLLGTSSPTGDRTLSYSDFKDRPPKCYLYYSANKVSKVPAYTASWCLQPGAFHVYWLAGTDDGSTFDVNGTAATFCLVFSLRYRYLMPSVV